MVEVNERSYVINSRLGELFYSLKGQSQNLESIVNEKKLMDMSIPV